MIDEILKLDLEKLKIKYESHSPTFIVFHDGRMVIADDRGHSRTIIESCKEFYPEWYEKIIDKMISRYTNEELQELYEYLGFRHRFEVDAPTVAKNATTEEKAELVGMCLLDNDWLERKGFVIVHNMDGDLMIYGHPKLTNEQICALKKINQYFEICMLEQHIEHWNEHVGGNSK